MCGITGFWVTSASSDLEEIANRMAMAIRYRGPDDSGTWSDGTAGVAFGFRRLAIITFRSRATSRWCRRLVAL